MSSADRWACRLIEVQQNSDKQAGASRSHEQRVAWEILRDSPTVRMLAAMAEERWFPSSLLNSEVLSAKSGHSNGGP